MISLYIISRIIIKDIKFRSNLFKGLQCQGAELLGGGLEGAPSHVVKGTETHEAPVPFVYLTCIEEYCRKFCFLREVQCRNYSFVLFLL